MLNLHVPGPGHGSLLLQLGGRSPAYAALCVSFFVIGVIWVHHHNLFKRVAMVDRPLMALNFVLLLCVTVFPFPTATLATYLRRGGSDAHIAAAAYGLVVEGVALSFFAITMWVRRRSLLEDALPAAATVAAARRYVVGAVAIAIAIGLSFVSAVLALAVRARLDIAAAAS